jgi:prepilin-type N-terminal cleavage/methylation domain-containing protein
MVLQLHRERCLIKISRLFSAGLTLVELLVVISIVGLLVSLVSPFGSRLLERARAQQERVEIERLMVRLSSDAFVRGQSIRIVGHGSKLSWTVDQQIVGERSFEYTFVSPDVLIDINRNGIARPGDLIISQSGRDWKIELNRGLETR